MAGGPVSASFNNHTPSQWLRYLHGSDSVAPKQPFLSHGILAPTLPFTPLDSPYLYEPHPMETQQGTPTDVGDRTSIYTVDSSLIFPSSPPLPSPQPATFQPPKWHKIPQRPYDRGRSQRGFTPSEPVLFQVNEFPGVNMGDALQGIFTGLENHNDLVLQDAKMAISCRFLFPGYPRNGSPQIFTTYWDEERSPITRSTLAYRVARKLDDYLDSMSNLHMDPSTEAQWEIGEEFMHLDNMYLAMLESTSRGSFQPQVWVMDPTV